MAWVVHMAEVALLGGIRAHAADGSPLDVGPPKCRLVLAALALHHGEPVGVPRLVDLVWGPDPPGTAPKIVQGYVSRLRKVLGAEAIATVGTAYRLEGAVAVDTTRFERLVADGDVDAALALWVGPPLAGLDPVGLQSAVDGLHQRWLDATEQRLARLVEDDPAAAVVPLAELTDAHPFREGLWAALMTALARSGRQADALAAYQRVRSHLVEELGIDPGTRLRELESQILAGDVGSPSRVTAPIARVAEDSPSRVAALPVVPDLLGRATDVEVVLAALRTASLVTLVGPGGVGKTSLAVTLAQAWRERHGGRVVLVELDEVSTAGDVVDAVAETLGVAEPPDGDLLAAIVAATGSQPTLLVLDNCEHVLPGAATLVGTLGAARSATRVLATSRERLGAVREHLHPVEPLDPEEGVELFLRRARAVAPGIDLRPDRAVVAEVCRELDGLPLAIELAAARSRSLTPAQLLERLGDRFRLLTDRRAGSARQATLEGAVAWSHDLLSPDAQRLFARLSVFAGPFDLGAAEAVAAGGGLEPIDVDRLLGDLVEQSMLASLDGPGGRRFRLLETLRQFAAGQLVQAGDDAATQVRHTGWVREETARIGQLLTGPREAEGVARLDDLWPNLRVAVDRAVAAGDARLADGLLGPIVTEVSTRRRGEIGVWAERILAAGPQDDDTVLFWLTWALHRHMQSGNRPAFEDLVQRYGHGGHPLVQACRWYLYEDGPSTLAAGPGSVAWLRERGHEHAADHMEMTTIGSGLMTTGRLDEAVTRFQEWVDRHASQGPPTFHYFSLGFLGYTQQLRGDLASARAAFLAAADVEVPPGTYAAARPAEVEALFARGDHLRALHLLREHIDDVLAMGTVDVARLVAVAFINVMVGLDRPGDAAPALAYLRTLGEFGEMALTTLVADAVAVVGDVEPFQGDGRTVLRHMRRCVQS